MQLFSEGSSYLRLCSTIVRNIVIRMDNLLLACNPSEEKSGAIYITDIIMMKGLGLG